MSKNDKVIVVFGVTGQQGSWVARIFKEEGWKVIGVSSRPGTKAPKEVGDIEMRTADLRNAKQVADASRGADVVFGVTNPWGKNFKADEEGEKQQVAGLINGVKDAGVKHLIFTSVLSLKRLDAANDPDLDMPHLRQKFVLYSEAARLNVPLSVLGPTHFMDNIGKFITITDGQINALCEADAKVPYVSCRDIAKMALVAAKLGAPLQEKNQQRYLPVWSDFVSGLEFKAIVKRIRGGKQNFDYNAVWELPLKFFAPEFLEMKHMFEKHGRPPHSENKEELAQLYETRKLLGDDHWTLEKFLIENGYDKKKLEKVTPVWQKAAIGVGVIAVVAGLVYKYVF